METKYKRVLFKISGESLSKNNGDFFHDENLVKFAKQMSLIRSEFPELEIVIVVGGGNIWRGKNINSSNKLNITNYDSDYIGMLATVMNGLVLKNYLENININCKLFSSFNLTKIANDYKIDDVNNSLKSKNIVICVGGTGSPFFTTDTTASLRACELNCEAIFMAKNKVDGVYDCDPRTNPNAKRFNKVSFDKCLELKLEVMDLTSFTLCKQNKIKIIVFNANEDNNFLKLLNDKIKYTIIE